MHRFEVPVIAVFTKYDQFLLNVGMDVNDYPHQYPHGDVSEVAEKRFQEHYLDPLGDVGYVRLDGQFRVKCQGYTLMLHRQECTFKIGAATILSRRLLQL